MVRNEVTDVAVLNHYDSIHRNVNQAREGRGKKELMLLLIIEL